MTTAKGQESDSCHLLKQGKRRQPKIITKNEKYRKTKIHRYGQTIEFIGVFRHAETKSGHSFGLVLFMHGFMLIFVQTHAGFP